LAIKTTLILICESVALFLIVYQDQQPSGFYQRTSFKENTRRKIGAHIFTQLLPLQKRFMEIQERLNTFFQTIPDDVQLVAVSKTKPDELILEAYNSGQRIFGENKVQDLAAKSPRLPNDIQWHFIGHLQRNKVKYIAPFVSMLHGIDSLKLLTEVNKQAAKNNRTIQCLLQFHIAEEETKFGLSLAEAEELINDERFAKLNNVQIAGVMGMATYTNNMEQVRKEFKKLKQHFQYLKDKYFLNNPVFKEISMGMSADYQIAIEEGSTMIRIGTKIFGNRN